MHEILICLALCAQLPPAADAKMKEVMKSAEEARHAYFKALQKVEVALVAELQKQLEVTTKAGDLDGALAIRHELDRLKTGDFVSIVEESLAYSRLLAAAENSLVGRWQVELVNGDGVIYASEWTFEKDGLVTSTNPTGATKGKWKTELGKHRIYIDWGSGAWDTFTLPLRPELVIGESWSGIEVTVRAKKREPK